MHGNQLIPALLSQQGVDVVFSMLGGTNCTWIADGAGSGAFRLIKTRHEETAINAAVGYSRATGTLGVASVTRGPGFANSINGLISATKSHVPMMLIVGESPPKGKARFSEQNIDQESFARLIGMGFHHADSADELEDAFRAAVDEAYRLGRPQVLSTSDAVIDGHTTSEPLGLDERRPPGRRLAPDQDSVSAVVDLLEKTSRPLVLAGIGAVNSGARDALVELADLVGARCATTLRANRLFDGHPHDLSICGSWSYPAAVELIGQSDVVLAFGASLNKNTTGDMGMFPAAKIVHCEINEDNPFKSSSGEFALHGDARATAAALVAEWHRRDLPARSVATETPSVTDMRQSILLKDLGHDPSRGLDVLHVLRAFDEKLPADRIVTTDSGRTKAATAAIVGARDARSWLIGHGYASVGLGIGTAIGAAAGQPGRPVAAFIGDGGLMMAVSALDTARLHPELNLKLIVLNDEQLGSEVSHLVRHGYPLDVVRQDLPDVRALADVFGGRGTVIRTPEELAEFEFLAAGLEIIDVRIDPEQPSNQVFR